MKKTKKITAKTPKELALSLNLTEADALEWEVRNVISKRIIISFYKEEVSITEIARLAGTSRARITNILKGHTQGISLDVLVRVLGAIGEKIKISFKKAA